MRRPGGRAGYRISSRRRLPCGGLRIGGAQGLDVPKGALQGLDKNEPVVPESELKAAKARIRELERLLGRKTMEAEILREGLELAREKKLLLRPPLLDKGASR